mmetsp:Transcript_14467/g.62772  ORF Transcript_14467/g.62772 Transcript_14467/m.62772 type:complete len:395 (-) Transcript_14467:1445-2629(-)
MSRRTSRATMWKGSLFHEFFKGSTRRFRCSLLILCLLSAYFRTARNARHWNPETNFDLDPCTQNYPAAAEKLYHDRGKRKLVVEVSHGLGNRLRAVSSAAALARISNRQLHIVWIQDLHLNASIRDLLYVSDNQIIEHSYLQCALSSGTYVVYDYLSDPVDESRRPKINTHVSEHIYIRTAYRVIGKEKEAYAASLVKVMLSRLRPSPTVLDFINRIEKQLAFQSGQSTRGTVGVHIRMQSDLERDVPGISSLGNIDVRGATSRMLDVAALRHSCHFKHFLNIIRHRQLEFPFENTYIISSDCTEARDGMIQELGSKAFVPELPEYGGCMDGNSRSTVCVQLALAEMLILSRTSSFIYSSHSSFSEVVALLGGFKRNLGELESGCLGGPDLLFK